MAVETLIDASADEELAQKELTVIKFFADWCGSCRLIAPKFAKLSNDERFSNVRFLEVNAEHNPKLRGIAKVTNLPTFATFRNGELVASDFTSKIETVDMMITILAQK